MSGYRGVCILWRGAARNLFLGVHPPAQDAREILSWHPIETLSDHTESVCTCFDVLCTPSVAQGDLPYTLPADGIGYTLPPSS